MERGCIQNCGQRLVANAVVLLLILYSMVWAYQHVYVCTSTDVYLVVLVHWILTHHTYTLCSCSLKRGEINSSKTFIKAKQKAEEALIVGILSPNHLKIHLRSKILLSADPGYIISNLSKRQYSIAWKHALVCSRPKPIILVWEGPYNVVNMYFVKMHYSVCSVSKYMQFCSHKHPCAWWKPQDA